MTGTIADPLAAASEALAGSGPASLAGLRREALEAFLAAPLPNRARHLWRYTDPRRLLPGDRVPAPPPPAFAGKVPEGFEVRDLSAAAAGPAAGLLGSLSGPAAGKFETLNLALFPAGTFVRVPAGRRPGDALVLIHRAGAAGTISFPRTLVLVEEGAEAAVVEEFEGPEGAAGMLHSVAEVFLGPGARLVHTVVNTLGVGATASLVQRARLHRAASLTSVTVGLGGGLAKSEVSAVLAGPGARSEVLGAVFGAGRQQADLHILQEHAAPRTQSDLLVRVALMERARASYTGRLVIAVGAPHSEARQENRNLLLSEDARADSIPELEILTHEVQCSHAASTGPVDPAMLFYLRSRGFSARDAEKAIVMGFLEPVFARVPGEGLADALRGAASRRLDG